MITFKPLRELMRHNKTSIYKLQHDKVIGAETLKYIRHDQNDVTTRTINAICAYLNCQPGDIMEYIPDEND